VVYGFGVMDDESTDPAVAFLHDLPVLHVANGSRGAYTGGLNPRLGNVMIDEIRALGSPSIIETGAGASTLLFMMLGCASVTSIAPDKSLGERIRMEAVRRELNLDTLTFINDRSERALPKLAASGTRCQAAFIDGDHGWPAVFVDFCYLNMMMDSGAVLFVDDVQIYACAQLMMLLRAQPEFEFVSVAAKMATFRKTSDRAFLPNHRRQPFIMMNSSGVQRSGVSGSTSSES
jgi:hypothetical protein